MYYISSLDKNDFHPKYRIIWIISKTKYLKRRQKDDRRKSKKPFEYHDKF